MTNKKCSQTVTEWPQQLTSQALPTITSQHPTPPQVQVQQEDINRLTNVLPQWSAGDQQRVEKTRMPIETGTHTTAVCQTCAKLCQTTMIIFIMTTRVGE